MCIYQRNNSSCSSRGVSDDYRRSIGFPGSYVVSDKDNTLYRVCGLETTTNSLVFCFIKRCSVDTIVILRDKDGRTVNMVLEDLIKLNPELTNRLVI